MAASPSFETQNEHLFCSHGPFPTQSTLQMPNVFVIPPEEEQSETPPWCFFDATKAPKPNLSTQPDLASVDIALNDRVAITAPVFRRSLEDENGEDIIMPKKGEKRPKKESTVINDDSIDDIVEVVKVGKKEKVQAEAGHKIKRSKTLKCRASQALRSLKNIGKPATRKVQPKEVWSSDLLRPDPSQIAVDENFNVAPRLSRRKSLTITQLFHTPQTQPNQTSDSPPPSPLRRFGTSPALRSRPMLPTEESDPTPGLRPSSPSPSSGRRRFSVLELHRMFSFSSSSSAPDLGPSTSASIPTLYREVSAATPTSIETLSDRPETPVDDDPYDGEFYTDTPFHEKAGVEEPVLPRDISFEMRLDSLHFDSLSFDPDDFDISQG